tara:strand:+ start:270 stop:596 length:327 start_codon:yes stop_codon:yes gene_type:complete
MPSKFASSKNALAECDICGFRFYLRELRNLIIRGSDTNIKACPECWNPDHPQNELGRYPVYDPQAIRNPRPDFTGYPKSRAMIYSGSQFNKLSFVTTGFVGAVTVSTS